MSLRAILNQVVEKNVLDYYGGQQCFTRDWKHQAILTFYMTDQPDTPPIFDICNVVCDSYPKAEMSALAHALSHFDRVLGWTIGDMNYIFFTNTCQINTDVLASG
jgi:hypothetical protein